MTTVARAGEAVIEVEVDGARDVSAVVGSSPRSWFPEIPADIRDPKLGVLEAARQGVHGDQRGRRHTPPKASDILSAGSERPAQVAQRPLVPA
jgi:hypothetical protein